MNDWDRPRFDIRPGNAALLVIDMQQDFVAEGAPYECGAAGREIVDRINRLAAACREADIPVILTAQVHRADGSDLGAVRHLHPLTAAGAALREGTEGVELVPEIEIGPRDHFIRKPRYSAFFGTDLETLLRNFGATVLLIAGVATNVCCESTARDAFFRDYEVVFLADATATVPLPDIGHGSFTADEVQAFTLSQVATFFGEVATVDDVVERVRAAVPSAERVS
jgi:nicotinamidase-related amidase